MASTLTPRTLWIGAVRCEHCGDITAAEFSGPSELHSYQPEYPVRCDAAFVREELHHPPCGRRIMLSEYIEHVDTSPKLDYDSG